MTFYPVWLTAASTRKTSVHSQQPLWLLHNTFNNALHSCWAWQHFTAISLFFTVFFGLPPTLYTLHANTIKWVQIIVQHCHTNIQHTAKMTTAVKNKPDLVAKHNSNACRVTGDKYLWPHDEWQRCCTVSFMQQPICETQTPILIQHDKSTPYSKQLMCRSVQL